MNQFFKWALVSLSLVGLSAGVLGCTSSNDNKASEDVAPDYSDYVKASCDYPFTMSGVLTNTSVLPRENIKTEFFGKKFDSSILEKVGGLDGQGVVEIGRLTGVEYFKTDFYKTGSCEYAAVLPDAPSDLRSLFDKYNRDSNSILGLYLSKGSKDAPSTNSMGAILVRRDANKWVLVHELMHHLFHKEISAKVLSDDALKEKVSQHAKNAISEIERYEKSTSSSDKGERAAIALTEFMTSFHELMVRFTLEETVIESLLGDEYRAGRLEHVTKGQRVNGASYIIASAKKVRQSYDEITAVSQKLRWKLPSAGTYYGPEYVRNLEAVEKIYDKTLSDLTVIETRAKTWLTDNGFTLKAMMALTATQGQDEPHVGCSHGEADKEIDEIMELVRGL